LTREASPSRRPRSSSKLAVPAHDDVGQRLRERREEARLSLRELARRLNISPSAISQIETGKSRPSVSTLYAIVSELGMSLDELFASTPTGASKDVVPAREPSRRDADLAPAANEATTGDGLAQRAASRTAIDLESGVRWERLTPNADPDADFLYVVYDVGGSSSKDDKFIRHSGREYGLVISGHLEVVVGFERYDLGPGDSISFDSTVPHRLRNVGTEPAHGVWCVLGRRGSDSRSLALAGPDEAPS
jgi:transcriptional regulator with XRE-family HTH domain